MKAARLTKAGTPLVVQDVPDPKLKPSGVVVEVLSAHVLSFSQKLFAGELPFQLPTPYTPGPSAIGRVIEYSADVTGLQAGDLVFLDPLIRSKVNGGMQDAALLGWFGMTPGSSALFKEWPEGVFAEKVLWPAECVTVIGESNISTDNLAALNYCGIAYGGLLKAGFRPGQSAIINGATGNLGSAAVLVALAMGASRVVAVGRKQASLESLTGLDKRVSVVALADEPEKSTGQIQASALGADAMIDAIGMVMSPATTLACMSGLRPGGTMVCIGGSAATLPIPYFQLMAMDITVRGAFMYPRSAPSELMTMARSGQLRLDQIRTKPFKLANIGEAVSAAAKASTGLDYVVINPK